MIKLLTILDNYETVYNNILVYVNMLVFTYKNLGKFLYVKMKVFFLNIYAEGRTKYSLFDLIENDF